ncbi:hypothetical protein [Azospirillum halopraeferens]|uniref:hypothetical protein n=1 Tax=Azospirillum halopraeferens TaxID=34010 RepID=UPI000423095D|nr:hypothetical protein [Azospirillum halopraeferens]
MSFLSMFRGRGKTTATDAAAPKAGPVALPHVIIDRHDYQTEEFAPGSFRIRPYEGDLIARQRFDFRIAFDLDNEPVEFHCSGIVVRLDAESGLVARYQPPQPFFERKLLEYLRRQRG